MPCEGSNCDVPTGTDDGFLGPLVWWGYLSTPDGPPPAPPEDLTNHSILPDENIIDTYFIPNGGIQFYGAVGSCVEPYCVQVQEEGVSDSVCCSELCLSDTPGLGFSSDDDEDLECLYNCNTSPERDLLCCTQTTGQAGWGIPFSARISFENYERTNDVLKYVTKQFQFGNMKTELWDGLPDENESTLLASIEVSSPENESTNLEKREFCTNGYYPCDSCDRCENVNFDGQTNSTITYQSYDADVTIEVEGYHIGGYWENFRNYLWSNSGIGWDSLTGDAWTEYSATSIIGIPDFENCSASPGEFIRGRNRMLAVVINPELASPLPGDSDGPPAGGPDPADGWVAARLSGACYSFPRNLTIDFSEQYELTGVTHPWVAGYSADRFTVLYTGSSPIDYECTFDLNPAAFRTEFIVNVNQGDEPGIPDDATLPDALEALYNQYDYLKVSFYDAEYTESQSGVGSPLGGYYQFGISGGSADITVRNTSTNRTSKWEWYDENGASYDAEAIPNLQSGLTGPLPSFKDVWGPILADYSGSYVWAQITGGTYGA